MANREDVFSETRKVRRHTREPELLSPGLLPPLFIITYKARRDVVVASGGSLRVSSFVSLVLGYLIFPLVAPGVGNCMSQLSFSLLKVVYKGTVVCAAPTGGGGAVSGQSQFLAAITH